ncbi:hypothetical protein AGMMS49545_08090 [Betaproteobacteria bacterium]|nr:hypothetical protein AGMMS49545_08090 [Betaproteobacteria bacterium]GHU40502.1 hypothetical protein AGMMS50289_02150 [Betaproteobacteria bacterium]
MSKTTAASVKSHSREQTHELTFQHHETESPVLPVAQLEHLHSFRPDIVDWVVQQTQAEAESRRRSLDKINLYVFTQRILGQILAFLLGLSGILGGGYIALRGQPWAGVAIASAVITGLAVTFLTGRENKASSSPNPKPPSSNEKNRAA